MGDVEINMFDDVLGAGNAYVTNAMGEPMTTRRSHHAGNCSVCGTAVDQQTLDEWVSREDPHCWKCGTFYFHEGNVFGISADEAHARALAFDERIDKTIADGQGS